jgi:tetratricopeptide (TPR) repeat protein
MKRFKVILPFLVVIGLIYFTGCEESDSTGPGTPTTVDGWIARGWAEYRAEDYVDAVDAFDNAVDMASENYDVAFADYLYAQETGNQDLLEDALARMDEAAEQLTEGLTGMGWALIGMDSRIDANTVFDIVQIMLNPEYPDMLGGFAVLLQIEEQWQQSNEKIDLLLGIDPTWEFEHNDIDYLDLRLMRAENYFFLAEYELSLQEALELNDLIGYQSGLTADDFNLATIEGRAALINLIDELDEQI